MLKFKAKAQQQEQGFTLIEVLVAILIITIFVTTAMQAMVIAAMFKARAKQFSEATTWIQQDLELVKQQAAILAYTTLSAAPTPGSPSLLSVSSRTGFASENQAQITLPNTTFFSTTISSISGNTITVNPGLSNDQVTQISNALAASALVFVSSAVSSTKLSAAPTTSSLSVSSTAGFENGNQVEISIPSTTFSTTISSISNNNPITFSVNPALTPAQINQASNALIVGKPVSVSVLTTSSTNTNSLCYANTQNNGFGNLLSSNLPAVPSETSNSSNLNSGTKTIAGKTYILSRGTPTVRNVAPYEVLQIPYTVVAQDSTTSIATLNAEVIPNAVFQCPPY